ncbi:hypothetical protein N7G274_006299 [Stereocaulon virgatum]|uniref:Uncharacterized protein n=1 Tax=Stereocaulon virgatum TaxID=373712 RepID=A0ABR4A646_9LECA
MPIHIFKPRTSRVDDNRHLSSKDHTPGIALTANSISALHITLKGTHERITSVYNQHAPPIEFGNCRYYIPQCLQQPTTTSPPIRRISFEFTNEDTSMGAAGEQQAFLGVYCIWYRETERPKSAREYEEMDGEFWILRQVQWRPEVGEVIEWEDIPEGMEEGMEGEWWFKVSVLPMMKRLMIGEGLVVVVACRLGCEKRCERRVVDHLCASLS